MSADVMTTEAAKTPKAVNPEKAAATKPSKAPKAPKVATKAERPEQIVITMDEALKVAVQKKCKETRTPVARAVRQILKDWVDGKITISVETATAKAQPTTAAA